MGHLSPLPTLPIRGSFLSSVRARSVLTVAVLVLLREAQRLSACCLCSLFPSHRCWEASSGLAGRWELAPPPPNLDQSTAELSKWQPQPHRASLLQKRQLSSADKPAPELLQQIKVFVSFKRGNRAGNRDVLALTLASPTALSKSSCLCVPQFHTVPGLRQQDLKYCYLKEPVTADQETSAVMCFELLRY